MDKKTWCIQAVQYYSASERKGVLHVDTCYSMDEAWGHYSKWYGKSHAQENTLWLHLYEVLQFSRSVVSDSLRPRGLQHARPPCPSPTPEIYSGSCPLSQQCHSTISSSTVLFSSCLQSFPASGSFRMSPFFASGGQSIGVSASASVLPMNIQDWFLLGWTGWISLLSKELSSES